MSALVHKLLTATQKYVLDSESPAATDCHLIELVVQMFQSLEIARDTDPELISQVTQGVDIPTLIETLITKAYAMISCPLKTLA